MEALERLKSERVLHIKYTTYIIIDVGICFSDVLIASTISAMIQGKGVRKFNCLRPGHGEDYV